MSTVDDVRERLALRKFGRVSFSAKCVDCWSALRDRAFKLPYRACPFTSYRNHLRNKVDMWLVEHDELPPRRDNLGEKYSDDLFDSVESERIVLKLKMDILNAKDRIEKFERNKAEVSALKVPGDDEIERDEKLTRAEYDEWRGYLARPAYLDKFVSLVEEIGNRFSNLKMKVEQKEKTNDSPKTIFEKFADLFNGSIRFLANRYLTVLVPVEAAYVYPSFEFLTPEDLTHPYIHSATALAAAIVFTAALTIAGGGFATFSIRAIRRRLELNEDFPVGKSQRYTEKKKYYILPLILAIIFAGLALFIANTGASLRAAMPSIKEYKQEKTRIDRDTKDLRRRGSDFDADESDIVNSSKKKLAIDQEANEKRGREILNPPEPRHGIDFYTALGIYLVLALSSAAAVLVKRDPIFEYYLVATRLDHILSARLHREVIKRTAMARIDDHIDQEEERLRGLRAQLKMESPDDPEVREFAKDAFKRADDHENHENAPLGRAARAQWRMEQGEVSRPQRIHSMTEPWITDRLRRYCRVYMIFSFPTRLEPYEDSIHEIFSES